MLAVSASNSNGHISPDESLAKHIADLYGDRPGAEEAQRAASELQADPWQQAVRAAGDVAKAKHPDLGVRIDDAVQLILKRQVEILDDQHATVASRTHADVRYV